MPVCSSSQLRIPDPSSPLAWGADEDVPHLPILKHKMRHRLCILKARVLPLISGSLAVERQVYLSYLSANALGKHLCRVSSWCFRQESGHSLGRRVHAPGPLRGCSPGCGPARRRRRARPTVRCRGQLSSTCRRRRCADMAAAGLASRCSCCVHELASGRASVHGLSSISSASYNMARKYTVRGTALLLRQSPSRS